MSEAAGLLGDSTISPWLVTPFSLSEAMVSIPMEDLKVAGKSRTTGIRQPARRTIHAVNWGQHSEREPDLSLVIRGPRREVGVFPMSLAFQFIGQCSHQVLHGDPAAAAVPTTPMTGVVYYTGTNSGSGQTLTDTTKSWTTNQFIPTGAPYSVYDMTGGWWAEIASNTANTLTIQQSIPEQSNNFNNGDSYQILRATVCADQGGRGAGAYVSGSNASPAAALSQALDPIYEWDDTASNLYQGNIGTDTGRTIANRDWYTDNSNGSPHAQTSPTSPFNGTSGVGFGTLANRPTTCTPNVGYFATDQGTWNTSGNGFGQGELFVCNATNTWTVHYIPYTYPHPLAGGTAQTGGTPAAPTGLTATAQ